ncbi:LysR family transcriptional regulator [Chelativorans salis]|uniref:LysR family transcriptional regulator n=1 Tax=Chelativorans salis TaxID=2978478 RepID=A0ABT2LSM0_9HYPH|nr:LysR family transcriptional regulator [Chelativorans sp. EGI FJ00035]MCT7376842.1 LysR family transcriptional regulator [Chelativorans sp. EGI FJ00035]
MGAVISFNIKQLDTFLWVATLGSFRKAAERLNTTQPAVSARIASLENALGVQLFERMSNTVRLTAMGQQLLPLAQRTLRTADKLQRAANTLATVNGVLRLGVAETIVHTWLSDFLREFDKSYPLVDVDLVVDGTLALRSDLLSHRLDIAVLMGPVSEYRIENVNVPSFPLIWVCAPHLDLPETRVSLRELLRFPVISYARATRPYSELYHKLSADADDAPRTFPANSLAASLRMTMDGIGIAVLPLDVVRDHIARGELRKIDCEWQPSDLQFTASFFLEPVNPIAEHAAQLVAEVAEAYAAKHHLRTAETA